MTQKYITGYCDTLSCRQGDCVEFMISGEGVDRAELDIVRIIHGDESEGGPGFIEQAIQASCNGSIDVKLQSVQAGNYAVVDDPQGHLNLQTSFTLYSMIWPTRPGSGRQAILTRWSEAHQTGYGLELDASGRPRFWLGDGQRTVAVVSEPLAAKLWYLLVARCDVETGQVTLHVKPVVSHYNSHLSPAVIDPNGTQTLAECDITLVSTEHSFLWSGIENDGEIGCLFDGKIDRSGVLLNAHPLDVIEQHIENGLAQDVIAYWDTSAGYSASGIGDVIQDMGAYELHARAYNRPVRAMTGYNWRGRDDCFRLAPEQYGGVYFHSDAIIDCGWQPTVAWTIPDDLKSGVYAARLRAGDLEDHLVFFVRPATPQAKVAMLMPTASYLAYANEHFVLDSPGVELLTAHPLIYYDWDFLLGRHPEWGRSTYDHHNDGAGVCYSSYRRPVMGLRPKHRMASTGVPWQFPADLSIIWWLENSPYEFDVITDEDLHRDGIACLSPYRVVINGTHSEYYSTAMLDATEEYLESGGRVMYLGANGYYWSVAFRDEEPWCMEVRKLNAGSRAWMAAPGEHYMASSGEKGGIWRDRARPPHKTVGLGFTSEGMDESKPYRKLPDAEDPKVAWIFAGVEAETFGHDGLALGGAAGIELDRYDLSWGTPPNTYLLACSEGHSDNYPHVVEEIMFNIRGLGGTQDYQIRGDVTFTETRNGGAVFGTGSIAWGQALPWNDGDNDVARITLNVLTGMLGDDLPR
ncbi:MAG: N,N-dimethylformamidase beta subunit family domain-containing protein [Pseudomonadota bacterium]